MMCMLLLLLGAESFSKATLEDQVRLWIEGQSPTEGQLHVGRVFIPSIRQLPSGTVEYDIRSRSRNQSLVGRRSLNVDIMIGGRLVKTLIVQAETTLETMVGVVNTDVNRGQPLSEKDIDWQFKRLDRIQSPLVTPEDFKEGLQAKTMLRAGSILDRRKVEHIPLVERGRMVTVMASHGGLTVRMRAKALQGGAAGNEIRLKNVDSGQLLLGRIRKDGNVSLIMY